MVSTHYPTTRSGTLLDTLHHCEHFLPWEHVVLVVDGDARSYAVVQDLQTACRQHHGQAFDVLYSAENGGKGLRSYVARSGSWTGWSGVSDHRDADGDHALNDLVNLMRLAVSLRANEGTE